MPAAPSSIDEYLQSQPDQVRPVLAEVRRVLAAQLPQAQETISYGMPAFRLPGGVAVYFAGWRHHWSLYPASPAVVEVLGPDLAGNRVSKGTIRFRYRDPVPTELLRRIAEARRAELLA